MAAQEPYDYIATVTADMDVTLSITPQLEVSEESRENTVIHIGDDESEERIILSSTPVFFLGIAYGQLSEADAGTVLDLYHTTAQGKGRSFKFIHDGHTYVVRFDCDLSRVGRTHDAYGAPNLRLKILGRIVDA